MEFWEVLKKRHCTRQFDSQKQVSEDQINKLLEAAKLAPSAGSIQDWHFEVIKDEEKKSKIGQAAFGQMFLAQAPIVIICCSNLDKAAEHYGDRGINLYSIQDVAAATENLFLAAIDLGLSACWIGAFNEDKLREILGLSKNIRPMTIMPIGYPS